MPDYVECGFALHQPSGDVPGVRWSPNPAATQDPAAAPDAAGHPPVALLCHGGSGHKRQPRLVRMGRWLAGTAGFTVIAIDGPYHGDRVPAPVAARDYQQLIVDEGVDRVIDRMTGDWLAALATIDAGPNVSVFGMSMGARFGLPLAAALGARLRCAVFGKFGIRQAEPLHPGLRTPARTLAAARAVAAPVLYHVQWDDAIFPRDGQFAVFGALASADKRLVARPGPHAVTHPGDERDWQEFIAAHGRP